MRFYLIKSIYTTFGFFVTVNKGLDLDIKLCIWWEGTSVILTFLSRKIDLEEDFVLSVCRDVSDFQKTFSSCWI